MRMTTWEAVIPNDTTPIVREVGGDADDLSQYARDCEVNGHHYVLYCHDQRTGPAVITMHRIGAVVKGNEILRVHLQKVPRSFLRWLLMQPPSVVDIARYLKIPMHTFAYERRRGADNDIIAFDRKQVIECVNVGVLLMRQGQNDEYSLYSNESSGSVEYTAFLQFLGREQSLQHGCIQVIKNDRLLFHVSTMIALPEWDKACLERKRHLGNDHILIMFKEHQTSTVDLSSIASSQNQVVFIMSKSRHRRGYTVKAFKKESVPTFEYEEYIDDHDKLLYSVMNAENAVCREHKIAGMLLRKRHFELWEIVRNKLAGK